jgi:hypothetical protein
MKYPGSMIYVALPVLDELDTIRYFIEDIQSQTFKNYKLFVCINQPDNWWDLPEKVEICKRNQLTIAYLKSIKDIEIEIIDRSSKDSGWKGKQLGVGWARKILMDRINEVASENDIILSLDADTRFTAIYFESIIRNFQKHEKAMAISVPYYHKLTGNHEIDASILRYEIYMRYFAINLWRIGSPFSFTALGSAIAFPLWAYRKIGGISPMKSGEDFYLLQKFCKVGSIINWNSEMVYPEARFSNRVFFGTGPAMIKGNNGDWESYPIYHFTLFDNVMKTYQQLAGLYKSDVDFPLNKFLADQFKDSNWWLSLRKNFKTEKNFINACYEKVDGLRVLQYLKAFQPEINKSDEQCLHEFLQVFYPEFIPQLCIPIDFEFNKLSIHQLNDIRNKLMLIEEEYQRADFELV